MIYQLKYYLRFKKSKIKGKIKFGDYRKLEEDMVNRVELFLMGR
jgi:hypothetical protein